MQTLYIFKRFITTKYIENLNDLIFSVKDTVQALEARGGISPKYEIGGEKTVTIIILDDDHRGKFGFADTDFTIQESVGHLEATVVRSVGARGAVNLPFKTISESATAGEDFDDVQECLLYKNQLIIL